MRYAAAVILAAGVVLGFTGGTAFTQSTAPAPDRVEEDWQLVIASPDSVANGPQMSTSMQPSGDDSSPQVLFSLNFRDQPHYQPGGLQVKVLNNNEVVTSAAARSEVCQTDQETITWTQRMSLSGTGGTVQYQILSGQSTTWGQFGDNDNLAVSFASPATSLSGYSPDPSVAKSAVTFESDHVASMTLLQVRYYQNGQLLSTDTTPRSVNLSH